MLVDRAGVPRITCNGLNPLTAPEQLSGSVEFVGAAWPDFDPAALVEVVPSPTPVASFVVKVPATEAGQTSVVRTPWYVEPTPPTVTECRTSLVSDGQVKSITFVNGMSEDGVLCAVSRTDAGDCEATLAAVLKPGWKLTYPFGGDDEWRPWVNQAMVATSLEGGPVLWSQTVVPDEKDADVEWTIQ